MSTTGYNFADLNSIADSVVGDLLQFINSENQYKEQVFQLGERHKNIGFNIFTSISDIYKRENLHSDILKLIFDPNSEKIGSVEYIKIFKGFIEKKLKKNIELDYKTVEIERETYKIDLLIFDKNDKKRNCIFVENKINNAQDRENQIGKYYKALKDDYNIQAIVYLTLSPLKVLDREYSIQEFRNEIEKILIEIPVVHKENEECLVNDVIDNCVKKAKELNNTDFSVYLEHYSTLLKYLGGIYMADNLCTKALYEIYSDKTTLKSFRFYRDLWAREDKLIGDAFKEYFQKKLGFKIHLDPPYGKPCVYKIYNDDISIGYEGTRAFGFIPTPNSPNKLSSKKQLLLEILNNEKLLQRYFQEEKALPEKMWIYNNIDYHKLNCLADLRTMVEELEKLLNEKMKK